MMKELAMATLVANKELVIVPGASHCDLYDGITAERSEGRAERGDSRGESREPSGKDAIPFDRIEAFYRKNLKSRLVVSCLWPAMG